MILGFESDADGRKLIASLNMDFVRHDATRQCLAIGEQGSLRWNGLTGSVEHFNAGSNEWDEVFKHLPDRDESYMTEWQHFIASISNGTHPLIGGNDGLVVLKIIDAARLSAATNAVTTVLAEGGP